MSIKIIAAVSKNGIIGANNSIPFHYPEDLQNFKALTTNSIIIMGRKTFESIKKPLPKRINYVITSSNTDILGIETFSSLTSAISSAKTKYPTKDIWLIGGFQIYQEGLLIADEIHLTITNDLVDENLPNLTRFPWINPTLFPNLETFPTKFANNNITYAILKK